MHVLRSAGFAFGCLSGSRETDWKMLCVMGGGVEEGCRDFSIKSHKDALDLCQCIALLKHWPDYTVDDLACFMCLSKKISDTRMAKGSTCRQSLECYMIHGSKRFDLQLPLGSGPYDRPSVSDGKRSTLGPWPFGHWLFVH